MTFIEKFNQIKKKYGKIDESKLSENFAVQVEMTDEDCGGIFYVANMNGPFAVEPYDYYDNTVSVKASSAVLEKILSCKSDPMAEFFAGNIQVEGDISHALLVVELMKKEPKKRAPRKTTAATEKTAEAKTAKKPAKEKAEKAVKAVKEKAEKAVKEKKTATKKSTKKATKE